MAEPSLLPPSEFHYRRNADGTWDSICLRCFLTIGTAARIEELADLEAAHSCYSKKPAKAEDPR